MPKNFSTADIEHRLSALTQSEVKPWREIGHLLNQIDHTYYWQRSSGSFTEWMGVHAKNFNLQESSLWRYLTATRYYETLQQTLISCGITPPKFDKLPDKISPESLELLSKLERVVPSDTFIVLAQEVISGSITRSKLRETWHAFRPALAGKTARGKGSSPPRIDPKNREQHQSIVEAMIFRTLSISSPKWLGVESPPAYGIFMNVWPDSLNEEEKRYGFDAIIAIQPNNQSPLLIHGIEIRGSYFDIHLLTKLAQQTTYCDYMWVAMPEIPENWVSLNIPKNIGVLHVVNNHVYIIRAAKKNAANTRSCQLAKGLLMRLLQH